MAEWRQQQDLKSEIHTMPQNTSSFIKSRESVTASTSSLGRPLSLPAQLNHMQYPRSLRRVSLPEVNHISNNIVDTSESMKNQAWPPIETLQSMGSENHRFSSLLSSQNFVIPEPKPIYPDLFSRDTNALLPTTTADTPISFGTPVVTPLLNPKETVTIADFEELFSLPATTIKKNDYPPPIDFAFNNNSIDIEGMD